MQMIEQLKSEGVNKIKVGIFDVDGVMRGKYINLKKFASALESGFGFCDVVFGWDLVDELYDQPTVTGWHTGYPDAPAQIDLSSCRQIPWEPTTRLFVADFADSNGQPHPVCPRQLLKTVLRQAQRMSYTVRAAFEYEFFLFRETPATVRQKKYRALTPFTPGMFGYSMIRSSAQSELFHLLIDTAEQMSFELEGIHTETGPGVIEAAISVDEGLAAADKAALFKTFIKVVAQRNDLMATFMAKWSSEYPGQSGHLHQSLWDDSGNNVFYDPDADHQMSAVMRSYLAGQLLLMPVVLPMIAPTINSYTRMIKGFWAPTHANWGIENRTCAIRAIPGKTKSQRLEYRLAAADGNPYLVMAAAVACGLYGVEHQLQPPAPVTGNAYDLPSSETNVELPNTLAAATEQFQSSEVLRQLFGDVWVDHFALTRQWENQVYWSHKTGDPDWHWMCDRYFEII